MIHTPEPLDNAQHAELELALSAVKQVSKQGQHLAAQDDPVRRRTASLRHSIEGADPRQVRRNIRLIMGSGQARPRHREKKSLVEVAEWLAQLERAMSPQSLQRREDRM